VPGATPNAALIPAPDPLLPIAGGDNTITRERLDPYVMVSGGSDRIEWEAGLRYETTDISIVDRTAGGAEISTSYETLLPSAHVRFNLGEDDRVFVSVARTLRNPSFSFLSPAVLEAELGDNDFVGNPQLKPETAWGLDVGYERRLGRIGVAGLNFFYRDVSDVIEVFSTGAVGSEGAGTFVYSARNTGDGAVWGVEFDFSAPLTIFGLENTGAFLNYSWLDSEIDDEFGTRTFNDQAESVLNIGFIHDMPTLNTAFGVTYRSQGDAQSRVVGEEIATSYGADLEAFIEHRFGERFTLRLTGSNLLDASKDEAFDKFDTTGDQFLRSFAEYELESESAGPVFQLVGRLAF
jgi:outer membrane receptor protein involved in Fe transport